MTLDKSLKADRTIVWYSPVLLSRWSSGSSSGS